jgi:hypothetical protein
VKLPGIKTWHTPTAPDPPKYRVLTRPMVWMAGWPDRTVRELYEMLYQYEVDYIFDSNKFTKRSVFSRLLVPKVFTEQSKSIDNRGHSSMLRFYRLQPLLQATAESAARH